MQIKQRKGKRASQGFGKEIDFTIKASAKAFEIVMSRLYTDPIKAIIRELSCNGYDAQIEAGNEDQPMLVHLPNRLEPYFCIRDYGIGLSEKDVVEIYTTIFESTKAESNDFTGCLGLGSKTPFSYTRNFVVESFYEGKHYIYNAYFNEESKPCMAPLEGHGKPTDEPNGVKITISVKNSDFENWRSKAEEVYEYFAVTPKVVGATINVKKPDYVMEGDNWKLRKKQWGHASGIKVVMGNVAYPAHGFSHESFDDVHNQLMKCNIDLFVNIGDVEMEASREGLHFNDRTIHVIKRRLNDIIEDSKDRVSETFKDCKSLWEARCKYNDLTAVFPTSILNAIGMKNIQWNGQSLFDDAYYRNVKLPYRDMENPIYSITQNYNGKARRVKVYDTNALSEIKFYENDLKTGGYSRTIKEVEDNGGRVILCKFADAAERKLFVDKVGLIGDEFILTSSLPKPVRAKGKSRRKTTKVCVFAGKSRYISHCWENEEDIDLSEGGYYVEINRHRIVDYRRTKNTTSLTPKRVVMTEKKVSIEPSDLSTIIKGLEIAGYHLPAVYGVKTSLMKKIKANSKWVNVLDLARNKLPKMMEDMKVAEHKNNSMAVDNFQYHNKRKGDLIRKAVKFIDKDSPVQELFSIERKKKLSTLYIEKCDTLMSCYETLFGCSYPILENDTFDQDAKEVFKRYIMLDNLDRWNMDLIPKEHVALYVNAVDNNFKESV